MTTLSPTSRRDDLVRLLSGSLDFHGLNGRNTVHNLHAFAARFPPQLPRTFIEGLTEPGDTILDPMSGSGTVVLESLILGRRGIGVDIDPLAIHQSRVKTSNVNPDEATLTGTEVVGQARSRLDHQRQLRTELTRRFDAPTRKFLDYWFLPSTQLELTALALSIAEVESDPIRRFLEVTFSSIIVTKSGGVSRAMDLAHGRPHRVESKVPRNAVDSFERKLRQNFPYLSSASEGVGTSEVLSGDVKFLPIADSTVDLIVTSPPYANAIDYMRAHKFALIWLGYPIGELSTHRGQYIGSERATGVALSDLPEGAEAVISELTRLDRSRARVLRRYFDEMRQSLIEMHRVLKFDSPAVIVVGSSTMRGLDVKTHVCLGEIARSIGFEQVGMARRSLDRNRRMMPIGRRPDLDSVIQRRMHEEYVLGLWKR